MAPCEKADPRRSSAISTGDSPQRAGSRSGVTTDSDPRLLWGPTTSSRRSGRGIEGFRSDYEVLNDRRRSVHRDRSDGLGSFRAQRSIRVMMDLGRQGRALLPGRRLSCNTLNADGDGPAGARPPRLVRRPLSGRPDLRWSDRWLRGSPQAQIDSSAPASIMMGLV